MIQPIYSTCIHCTTDPEKTDAEPSVNFPDTAAVMPVQDDTLLHRSSSSSSSGNGPVAPARPRKLLKQTSPLSVKASSSFYFTPQTTADTVPLNHENFPSPGEITGQNMQSVRGDRSGSTLVYGEKFHELSTADLVVVIDAQQALLDKLNTENRDLSSKSRMLERELSLVTEENNQMRSVVSLRSAQSNMDYLLQTVGTIENVPPTNGSASTVKSVQNALASQVQALEAELTAKEQERQRLADEITFIRQQLQDKISAVDELQEKLQKAPTTSTTSVSDMEGLVDTLSSNIKTLKLREANLLTEIAVVKEQLGQIHAENTILKDVVHRQEIQSSMTKTQLESEMLSLQRKYRSENERLVSESRDNADAVQLRQKDLDEQLQAIQMKLTEERLRREKVEAEVHLAKIRSGNVDDIVAESVQQLQSEMAQLRAAASAAEERSSIQHQHDECERQHYMTKWKNNEDQLLKLKHELELARTASAAVGQENAQLLMQLADVDRQVEHSAAVSNHRPLSADAEIDVLKSRIEQREKELQQLRQHTAAADEQLQDLWQRQTQLIEKFKDECAGLAGQLDSVRGVQEKERLENSVFHVDVSHKYGSAVELNRQLLAECQSLAAQLLAIQSTHKISREE
ncbi:paramyosin-like [Paramacrobiotus metropolitanus]|uniref:paramyosin-like n=1 Tax=Paramacrobiotus metropolitanus TaxID=2943436 RepID=UPI00244568B2|nr:paramyosin-like [Paramacrobiotus metropolitanus]